MVKTTLLVRPPRDVGGQIVGAAPARKINGKGATGAGRLSCRLGRRITFKAPGILGVQAVPGNKIKTVWENDGFYSDVSA